MTPVSERLVLNDVLIFRMDPSLFNNLIFDVSQVTGSEGGSASTVFSPVKLPVSNENIENCPYIISVIMIQQKYCCSSLYKICSY